MTHAKEDGALVNGHGQEEHPHVVGRQLKTCDKFLKVGKYLV